MTIRFSGRDVLLDGAPNLVIGGEFQYFRIPRDLWRPSLTRLRDAGLDALSAYVPWIWHEVAEGDFDFTGRTDPSRDLYGLLDMARELGLPIVIKPGPFIYAEYQGFGVPHWLKVNHPEVMMVVHRPQEYPIPSLNHPGYLALVKKWFEQVADVIRADVAAGHVIAIQIDNETGYPQFGQGPHLTDRNPETLLLLRAALEDHFGTVEALNTAWKTNYTAFSEAEPPAERLYNEGHLDTMARWVEDFIVHYLANLYAIWKEIGLDTHYFLNDIWLDTWPSHIGKKNQVAPLAYDIYARYSTLPVTFDQPYCISYVPKLFGAFLKGGPLVCAELGCGWLDPGCEVTNATTWQSTLAAWAHGTRAVFYYVLMDGSDPDGPYVFKPFIDQAGNELPRISVLQRLAEIRREWGRAIAQSEPITSSIAILHHPAITRDMMAAAVDPLGAVFSGSQRPVDEAITIVSVNAGLYGALVEAGYQPTVRNLFLSDIETLCGYSVIFFNSIGSIDAASREKLAEYVRRGGNLVTLGTPFEQNTELFPGKVVAIANPQSWQVFAGIAWDYVKLYWRIARQFRHTLCAYTVENMYPAMLMTKHAIRAGHWMVDPITDARVWASRLVTAMKLEGRAKTLLTFRGRVAGFVSAVGLGRSAFIGTLLGANFDSPGYYLDAPERKRSISLFLGRLLDAWGLKPLVTPMADVEAVIREGDRYRVVMLFNRGEAKGFETQPHLDWAGWRLVGQFGGPDSSGQQDSGKLMGAIAADDVLGLVWEREPH